MNSKQSADLWKEMRERWTKKSYKNLDKIKKAREEAKNRFLKQQ